MTNLRYTFLCAAVYFLSVLELNEGIKLTPTGDENVKFEQLDSSVRITIDENVAPASLFYIEEATGTVQLHGVAQCSGFNYEIAEVDEGKTVFKLTTPLDYEADNCQMISSGVEDSEIAFFDLHVNNLDDNPPHLELPGFECELKENTQYTKEDTPCLITMTDRDGMMENAVLSVTETYKNNFAVSFLEIPSHDAKETKLSVYLVDGFTLDYETINQYFLTVTAKEEVTQGNVQMTLKVIDMPDTPPKWVKIFSSEQFPENKDQSFTVKAIDGDLGINDEINYKIIQNGCVPPHTCEISIGEKDGTIKVINVDREDIGDTINLEIQAYEVNYGETTEQAIYFSIEDEDDNSPRFIESVPLDKTKDENYNGVIGTFEVEDMDLADYGIYTISMELEPDGTVDYCAAFQVIPTQGYQKSEFTLSVKDSSKLDYDNEYEDWKIIKFVLVATEKADNSHVDRRSVIIHLNDLNDEPPIFVSDVNHVEVNESIPGNTEFFSALATDRDAGDIVTYSILGNSGMKLKIGETGMISTTVDDAFDYETLKVVVIQIRATDKDETHETFKTLTINVLDVDDTPPKIKVEVIDGSRISIDENGPPGEILNVQIIASDPDTKPDLQLEIDWTASYTTKNSVVKKFGDDDWMCFELTTEDHGEFAQSIKGILKTSERCRPDFELYDTVVLTLKVTDKNTVKGSDSFTETIQILIQDINDNEPIFDDRSFNNLKVTDGTETSETIGKIDAHDPDISDTVTFFIEPMNENYNWVDIDSTEGTLTIKEGVVINDDIPPTFTINYTITASDGLHKPTKQLTISMIDINNQPPKILNTNTKEVSIYEKQTEGTVIKLEGKDLDRDDAYHTIIFQFETSILEEARDRFDISSDGLISINLKNGAKLDRDSGLSSFILPVLLYDNPNGLSHLQDHFVLTIKLLDINDHPPIIIEKTLECSENTKKGDTLGPITAKDIDEEGPNSNAKFEIYDIQSTSKSDMSVLTKDDLYIESSDFKTATLKFVQRDLEGLYGEYDLTIHTSDYGDPPQSFDNVIKLTVTKFNFYAPVFVYPKSADVIILSEDQIIGSDQPLKLYNQEDLPDLEVDDSQNHKWPVTFEITKQSLSGEKINLFSIKPVGTWKTRLVLSQRPNPDDMNNLYSITIEASVKPDRLPGEAPVSIPKNIQIRFFSTNAEPEFDIHTCVVNFYEDAPYEHPSNQPQQTKTATFPSEIKLPIFYVLLDHTDTFEVDENTGFLNLKAKVQYKDTPSFDIKIAASKNRQIFTTPPEKSTLNVHVNIEPLNIHKPVFNPSKFNGAFLKSFNKQTTIVTVTATDEDTIDKDQLRFRLDSFDCLKSVQAPSTPFDIGDVDGHITPNFILSSDMSGYCTMTVYVTDGKDHYGEQHTVQTTVQINIISTDELVRFTFLNEESYINENQEQITATLDKIFEKYEYKSNLADLNYDPEWRNTTADFYFLDSDMVPMNAKEILSNLTDFDQFITLKKALAQINVNLGNFPGEIPLDVEDYLKIWLIATTIVLATFLMLLSVAFFFRNRALTQRINKLSTTKFGSQESNLNRAGLAAPTTNRNAVEGSNPVFSSQMFSQNELEIDTKSINSMDSDLFGVENNPEFDI